MPRDGECRAGHAAADREHEALGEQLTQQACTAGPERNANPHLPGAGNAAREQEICHVDARDEQNQADGGGEDEQRRFHRFDELILHADDPETGNTRRANAGRRVSAQDLQDRSDFRGGRLRRPTLRETSDVSKPRLSIPGRPSSAGSAARILFADSETQTRVP